VNPELKAKWVKALRSGRYRQTDGTLRVKPGPSLDGDNKEYKTYGYCCLGVLCTVSRLGKWIGDHEDTYSINHGNVKFQGDLLIYSGKRDPKDTAAQELFGLGAKDISILTTMNDVNKASFKEIADYVETNL